MPKMLRIELPLPPRELSPNARIHWRILRKVTREAKDAVVCAVLSQRPRGKPLATATVTVSFVVPDNRRRDHGNLISSTKAYMDGLVLAGVIVDDDTKHIKEVYPPVEMRRGKRMTIIEVE